MRRIASDTELRATSELQVAAAREAAEELDARLECRRHVADLEAATRRSA
jgi:hypothetical protein